MKLPYSDELNIGYLSRLFDNTTNCYKFFWFMAILRRVDRDYARFTFDELIDEMIADAWYMVTEYNLRLGPLGITDNLEETVKYVQMCEPNASEKVQSVVLDGCFGTAFANPMIPVLLILRLQLKLVRPRWKRLLQNLRRV